MCDCGARYERAEAQLPIKDVGVFECGYCGLMLEHWHGRNVPTFTLISPPKSEKTSVA